MGRPKLSRARQREFWRCVAAGASTLDAAHEAGVSRTVATRWFGEAGGMSPLSLAEPSSRYLSIGEREEIAILFGQRVGVREIARRIGRPACTVSRELARNSDPGWGAHIQRRYRATVAQAKTDARVARPKPSKLAGCQPLRDYVQDKLICAEHWSPQQISHRIRVDFPDDERMRIGQEAIYQAIYVQGRGALRRDLAVCLRTGRAVRKPNRQPNARRPRIPKELLIGERPAEVNDRDVPGHWEGDLIVGKDSGSAIGTLVERTTRFTMLLHLPAGDRGAEAVRDAILQTITTLPAALRRSLTWDQGVELARHAQISFATDLAIYFCDPHSPWQRGTNENTNGLLRQYFPKGTDLSVHDRAELDRVAAALNGRPRKPSTGERQPKPSPSYSQPANQPSVLRRPPESAIGSVTVFSTFDEANEQPTWAPRMRLSQR